MTLQERMRKRAARLGKRRPLKPVPPTGLQLQYLTQLRKLLKSAKARVDSRLVPLLPELTARAAERRGDYQDAIDPTKRVNKLMDRISESFYREWDPERLSATARATATAVSEFQKQDFTRRLQIDPLGTREPGLAQRVKDFTGTNVALIKRMSDKYLGDVEHVVTDGIRSGARHEDIAEDLEERFGVAESHAKLIARDQVNKFNGELNQFRQQNLGIEQFIWRTVGDERVRTAHAEFDGNTYDWDDPPGDGSAQEGTIPGSAVNCRCYSDPVIPELDDDSED